VLLADLDDGGVVFAVRRSESEFLPLGGHLWGEGSPHLPREDGVRQRVELLRCHPQQCFPAPSPSQVRISPSVIISRIALTFGACEWQYYMQVRRG
jgi:hypothetical protein